MPDFTELNGIIGFLEVELFSGAWSFNPAGSGIFSLGKVSIAMYKGDTAIYSRARTISASTTATLEHVYDDAVNLQVPTGKKWKVVIILPGATSLGDVVVRGSATADTADGTVKLTYNTVGTNNEFYTSPILDFAAAEFLTITNPAGASISNIRAYIVESNA